MIFRQWYHWGRDNGVCAALSGNFFKILGENLYFGKGSGKCHWKVFCVPARATDCNPATKIPPCTVGTQTSFSEGNQSDSRAHTACKD